MLRLYVVIFAVAIAATRAAAANTTVTAKVTTSPAHKQKHRSPKKAGVKRYVPNAIMEACVRQQHDAVTWIFVRGMHHSGTTLLGKLLALHPNVSPLDNGGRFEDEGMHLQRVFPTVDFRTPATCKGDLCVEAQCTFR